MIARRTLLAAVPALLAAQAAGGIAGAARAAVPESGTLAFRVMRKGSAIGMHRLHFEPRGDDLTVRIEVDLAVGIGPIVLYRYRHRAAETWENGTVTAFRADTDDDGARSSIAMQRRGEALAVESSRAGSYVAPPGALPATHWNRRMLDGPFINTQTGAVMRPRIVRAGPEPLPWAPQQRAERFTLSGDVDLETWYDAAAGWRGLRFRGEDGSPIHYELA